jgi:hypothetical protein
LHDRRPDRAGQQLPLAMIATAMPRLRVNQSEVSAISGPNGSRRRR